MGALGSSTSAKGIAALPIRVDSRVSPARANLLRYHVRVIQRLYVHNYRCLENFELKLGAKPSVLLIGKNGAGKSTVGSALELLQAIARGTNRIGLLVKPKDLTRNRSELTMRFELEVMLDKNLYKYVLALELPEDFRELRVREESLLVSGKPVFSREVAQVELSRTAKDAAARFMVDWHLIALPIIQEQSESDPIFIFKRWLSQILILAPIPSLISGDSTGEALFPERDVKNVGEWFAGLIAHSPASYAQIDKYLKSILPDLWDIKNPIIAAEARSIQVQFRAVQDSLVLPFADLSDGEKCFFISALVLAANESYGPIFCFWDEPDNYLSIDEVGHFIATLRRSFESGGQILVTSHNSEAVRRFSGENTILLHRRNHLEPTQNRMISELEVNGDLVGALIRGDVDPWP